MLKVLAALYVTGALAVLGWGLTKIDKESRKNLAEGVAIGFAIILFVVSAAYLSQGR